MKPVIEPFTSNLRGPSAAVMARNILLSAPNLRMGLLNLMTDVRAHLVTADGDLLVVPASAAPERLAGFGGAMPMSGVHVMAYDLSPVPLADRIRGSLFLVAKIVGREDELDAEAARHLFGVEQVPEGELVLRLRPRRIQVTRRTAGEGEWVHDVDLAEYRVALPDPLLFSEDSWLNHLNRDHADVLSALAGRLTDAPWRGSVRPVALDAYGLTLRVGTPDRDLRLAFDAPARCGCEMVEAFGVLLDRMLPGGPWLDCAQS